MPSAGNVFTGTAAGAAQGFAIGGPIGAGVGGFIGALGSIFGMGESPEKIWARRKREAQLAIAKVYADRRRILSVESQGAVAQGAQGATRRALASGREVTEGDIAAGTAQAVAEGGRGLRELTAKESEEMAAIEAGYAARPIEEDMPLSDVLQSLGASAANIAMVNKQIGVLDAQKKAAEGIQTVQVAPEGTYLDEQALGIPEIKPTIPDSLSPVQTPPPAIGASGQPLGAVVDEGVGSVLTALQSTNPNAQGAIGARQGWSNRMYNNSRAKVPGTYSGLMKQIGGRA